MKLITKFITSLLPKVKVPFSKEFWQQVRSDFIKHDDHTFICHASNGFKDVWEVKDSKDKILKLAYQFLFRSKYMPFPYYSLGISACLFASRSRQLRLDFLNWVLEQIGKEENDSPHN
jgi:hypothetical protein